MLSRILRVLVAVVLLVVLAYGVDWRSLPPSIEKLAWPTAIASFIALTLQWPLSAWKWQWALRLHGLEYPYWHLLKAICVGFFFNHFLPSGIGGDAYRVMKTLPREGFASRALSAVVVERIVGFAALLLIAIVAGLWLVARVPEARTLLTFFGIVVATIGVIAWAIHRGWHERLVERVRHMSVFEAVEHNVNRLRAGRREWVPLIGLSVLFQIVAIAIIYGFFWSLNESVSYATCALIAAAAGIATILPISINGLGVVEGAFAGTAVALGVDYDAALVVALLLRVLLVPYALVFGLLYASSAARKPKPA
jgi:glycosyltransferase 2 family protein